MAEQTAVDWYFDKIKSHFEHDGDLFEVATFTYAIAKQKEREQIEDAFQYGKWNGYENAKDVSEMKDPSKYYNETYNK
jgi:hypothetical protein